MSDRPDDETRADESRATETPRDDATPEGERIAKAIARAGLASRRDAEALIEAGRVTLNGQVLTSPAMNVTEADRITVDGEPLPARERTRLWILHKARGVVTTARDPEGRQTVFDGLPEDLPRVVAIGRLDINTEGLLLLTNDGGLAKVIAHPETGWLRRYRVRAFGDVTQPQLDRLRGGLTVDGMEYGPIEASLDRAQGDNVWLTLGLREGKNREVKRILEHLGLSVNRLIRLSFGPFQLGDLEVGLVEEIRTKVLKEQLGKTLSEQAGVDFESPVREPIAPFGSPKKAARAAATAQERAAPARKAERRPRADGGERAAPARSRGAERPGRDPARPAASARVPTGGFGPGPRRSVWRADEAPDAAERPGASRVPRRGADPKAAQATAAERGRERVGAIKAAGDRRVLVERLQPSPEPPAAEPHRRVKFRTRDEADTTRPARGTRAPEGDARPQRRGPRSPGGAGDTRPSERPAAPGGERRPRGDFDRQAEGGRRERPAPREGGRDDRREGSRDERAGGGFRSDKPRAGKPGGFKSGGFKAGGFKGGGARDAGPKRDGRAGRDEGASRGGFRAGGGKPGGEARGGEGRGGEAKGGARGGGFKSGGFKGGRPGGAGPAGGRPAGARPGGGRPGGARPGGARPGGSSGGGRPPRGGGR